MSSIQSLGGASGINKVQKVNSVNNLKEVVSTESNEVKSTVTISNQAQILSQGEVDLEKVNSIKEQIKNGTYTPNAENIAKKMMQEVLVMLKK